MEYVCNAVGESESEAMGYIFAVLLAVRRLEADMPQRHVRLVCPARV